MKGLVALAWLSLVGGACSDPPAELGADGGRPDAAPLLCPGCWDVRADLPSPIAAAGAVAVNDRIYLLGGLDGSGGGGTAVWSYDGTGWTREEALELPRAYRDPNAVAVDGVIYLLGGWQLDGSGTIADAWRIDPTEPAGGWQPVAPMAAGRRRARAAVALWQDAIYVVGGTRGFDTLPTGWVDVYDPASDTWAQRDDLSLEVGIVEAHAVAAGDALCVFGGFLTDGRIPLAYATTEVLRLDDRGWTVELDMPAGRAAGASGMVGDSLIVVAGGTFTFQDSSVSSGAHGFDVATGAWVTLDPSMPAERVEAASVVYRGALHVIGGSAAFPFLAPEVNHWVLEVP